MESMSINPAVAAIGTQMVDVAGRGLGSVAAAAPSLTALAPAGAEEVSMQAAMAFATEAAAVLALNTAAQEELARAGAAVMDIARLYAQVDGDAAGTLMEGGSRFSNESFAAGTGANGSALLIRSETLSGARGPAARTSLTTTLTETVATSNPKTAVPVAANAASTALGAGTVPLSSIASAGGAAGSVPAAAQPGLVSSLEPEQDEGEGDNFGDEQPGGQLL
ncbi:hypothetical protein A5641_10300 [Mycobacterium sp. 1554424.7]|nr:hypothetical protein A5641_10300 [Mycobacterium sp. 1554424.7]